MGTNPFYRWENGGINKARQLAQGHTVGASVEIECRQSDFRSCAIPDLFKLGFELEVGTEMRNMRAAQGPHTVCHWA